MVLCGLEQVINSKLIRACLAAVSSQAGTLFDHTLIMAYTIVCYNEFLMSCIPKTMDERNEQ